MQIQIRSQLIRIYTVCKGKTYPGSAGLGLISSNLMVHLCGQLCYICLVFRSIQSRKLSMGTYSLWTTFLHKYPCIYLLTPWSYGQIHMLFEYIFFMLKILKTNCSLITWQLPPWNKRLILTFVDSAIPVFANDWLQRNECDYFYDFWL